MGRLNDVGWTLGSRGTMAAALVDQAEKGKERVSNLAASYSPAWPLAWPTEFLQGHCAG